MLNPVRKDPQRENLGTDNRLSTGFAVGQHAGEFGDLT